MMNFLGRLIVVLTLFSSCATLNQADIKNSSHKLIEQQQLKPMLDLYGERVDILRNKSEAQSGPNNEGTEDMPYHDAGFYIGNGLFYDLNGNLCLLPLTPFFNLNEDFKLLKKDKSGVLNSDLMFYKTDSSLTIKTQNGIGFTKNFEFKITDSVTIFSKGKLMNMEFHKKNNGSYAYKRALANEDLRKIKNGYMIKHLLNKEYYTQKDNRIILDDRAIVVYRDNMIEIFEKGWSTPKLKYQMLVNDDNIIIYDNKFRGYKLVKEEKFLTISKNQKHQAIYEFKD